ncbi:hypothetical protein Tco_0191821, partial [Tanacetum coccineum]
VNSTNNVNDVNVAGIEVNVVGAKISIELPNDLNMPELEDIVYLDDDEDVGAEADMQQFEYIYACQSYSNYKNTQRSSS